MSGTAWKVGQLTELNNRVMPSIAKTLPMIAEKFGDPKRVLKALENQGELLAKRLETMSLEDAIKSFLVLIPRGRITITLSADHSPAEFWRDRCGLFVWDNFLNRIVARAKPMLKGTTFTLDIFELGEPLTDAEIEVTLPKNHLFDESAISAILAELVTAQEGGKPGHLRNTGHANLLYTGSSVADGDWDGVGAEWIAHTVARGGVRWGAGSLVFSPAN